MTVPAGTNQPVWLIVQTPRTCAPGVYRSALTVAAGGSNLRVPVTVRVRDITLPPERTLQITNWFSMGNIAAYHGVTMWSESFWKVLDVYARFMADYRQNAARTMLFDLITASEDPQGRLTFDFSRFDRFVELLEKAGLIGTIEGSHLAYRTDWKTQVLKGHRPVTTLPGGSQKKWAYVQVDSPEQREFLAQFLPALVKHLEEKGWRERYVQHLSDEPVAANAAAYNALAAMVREFAPGVKTIDATMCREVAGSVDIWVPQPSEIDRNREFFDSRRKLGEQVWIYTCLNPKGRYMNRFIDYTAEPEAHPLDELQVRLRGVSALGAELPVGRCVHERRARVPQPEQPARGRFAHRVPRPVRPPEFHSHGCDAGRHRGLRTAPPPRAVE